MSRATGLQEVNKSSGRIMLQDGKCVTSCRAS